MPTLLIAALLSIVVNVKEGDVQAFPQLLDGSGAALADGRYLQRVEGNELHIDARYDFPDGRVVEEHARLKLAPELQQRSWEWSEKRDGAVVRRFTADFDTGRAYALHVEDGKAWDEKVDIHPGKTFAGIGFVVAVKNLRATLAAGQSAKLEAIGFTPKPRTIGLTVRHDGPDELHTAGRTIAADAWTLHPEVPAIAKLFVKAPDERVWLLRESPPALLRFEGPMVEPSDPIIRIDSIASAPANGAATATRDRTAAPRKAQSRAAPRTAHR